MADFTAGKASHWRGVVMVIVAASAWGVMAVLAKLLFRDRGVDPLTMVVARSYVATFALFGLLALCQPDALRLGRRAWASAAVVGVGGLLTNNFLYFKTIHLTSVATALLLQYQAPILVAVYAAVVQRERLARRLVLALVLAVAGCALVVRAYDPGLFRPNLPGVLTGLGTAVAFAFYMVASRQALTRMPPLTLVAYGYLAASLVWAVLFPPWRLAAAGYDAAVWVGFLTIGTVGTALPFALFISGLRLLTPTRAGLLSMLEPVVATLVAYLVLGETLLPAQLLGAGLVLLAVFLAELR